MTGFEFFAYSLQLLLIAFKLVGYIDWEWYFVLAIVLAPVIYYIIVELVGFVAGIVALILGGLGIVKKRK